MKNYYNSYGLRSFFTVGLMSLSVLIVASCAVNYSIQPYLYDKISVAMNGNQLFGNLSDYNLNNRNVRSSSAGGSPYSVTLESLLDRSRTETMTLKKSQEQIHLRQIPFISNSAYQYAYLQDSNATRQVHCPDSMYVVKQFLVELKNETRHYDETFVVAMISAPDFVNKYSSHTELSWLERANFTGLSIVYSLNGDFSSVNYLENGRVISAKLRKPGEPDDDRRCHYLMIPSIRKTRAGEITEEEDCWYDEIEASYCIVETGGREDSFVNRNREGEWESDRDRERDGHSGGGGSGGSDNSGGGPGASENQLFYIVDLTSDINCSVTGSGIYAQGSLAICNCYPNSALYAFDRWVGDLSGKEWSCLSFPEKS